MELKISLVEIKDGIKHQENMMFPEDQLLMMTSQQLWYHYIELIKRIDKRIKDYNTLKTKEQ